MLNPGLLTLVDKKFRPDLSLVEIVTSLLDAELDYFILRNASKEDFTDIRLLQKEMDFDFIVHSDWDLAAGTHLMGAHLNSKSDPIRKVRDTLDPHQIVGYSAHSLDEAIQAEQDGANYLILGAVFPTPKENPNHPILGTSVLKQVCRRVKIPVFAIGGVTAENLIQVRDAEAYGFCAVRAVYDGDIEHNIRKLNLIWEM